MSTLPHLPLTDPTHPSNLEFIRFTRSGLSGCDGGWITSQSGSRYGPPLETIEVRRSQVYLTLPQEKTEHTRVSQIGQDEGIELGIQDPKGLLSIIPSLGSTAGELD